MTHWEMQKFFERTRVSVEEPTNAELEAVVKHFETCEEKECREERERAQKNERARAKVLCELWGEGPYGFERQWLAQGLLNYFGRK